VIDIIKLKSKDRLYGALHMASFYLNPYCFYQDDMIQNCIAAKDGIMNVMELFYPNVQLQLQINYSELEKYKDCKGSFCMTVAAE